VNLLPTCHYSVSYIASSHLSGWSEDEHAWYTLSSNSKLNRNAHYYSIDWLGCEYRESCQILWGENMCEFICVLLTILSWLVILNNQLQLIIPYRYYFQTYHAYTLIANVNLNLKTATLNKSKPTKAILLYVESFGVCAEYHWMVNDFDKDSNGWNRWKC